MRRRVLNQVRPGALVRLHRGAPVMQTHGVRGRVAVLGLPGALPHIIHHRPQQRVEVIDQ